MSCLPKATQWSWDLNPSRSDSYLRPCSFPLARAGNGRKDRRERQREKGEKREAEGEGSRWLQGQNEGEGDACLEMRSTTSVV